MNELSSENDKYEGKERTATNDIHKEKLKKQLLKRHKLEYF